MVYLILKVKIILSQQEHTKTQLLFFLGGGIYSSLRASLVVQQ